MPFYRRTSIDATYAYANESQLLRDVTNIVMSEPSQLVVSGVFETEIVFKGFITYKAWVRRVSEHIAENIVASLLK